MGITFTLIYLKLVTIFVKYYISFHDFFSSTYKKVWNINKLLHCTHLRVQLKNYRADYLHTVKSHQILDIPFIYKISGHRKNKNPLLLFSLRTDSNIPLKEKNTLHQFGFPLHLHVETLIKIFLFNLCLVFFILFSSHVLLSYTSHPDKQVLRKALHLPISLALNLQKVRFKT